LKLEPLEERHLLSATSPTGDAYSDAIKNGPYARGGEALYQIMNLYGGATGGVADTTQGMGGSAAADYAQRYLFDGDSVQLYLRSNGNFASFQQELVKLGVGLGPSDASLQVVQADVPYTKIDAVAALPQIVSMNPIGRATTHNQGRAFNQADVTMRGEYFRVATQVTGAGQTVGVLSDSVSQRGNGLLDSYNTLDLPGNVAVIEDFPTGTDEGRAMLELIHDIAPNAGLAFATAFTGQLGFAQNIDALRTIAGATVIVDDVFYFAEPFFQPGVIDQAIKRAVDANIPYFSSAGNSVRDGYEAPLRFFDNAGVQTNDWNPNGGRDTALRINIGTGGFFDFQWDNPYNGVTGIVTADLDITVRTTAGVIVAQSLNNNFATGVPIESLVIPAAGAYDITVTYVDNPGIGRDSTAQPTRIRFNFDAVPPAGVAPQPWLTFVEYDGGDAFRTGTAGHGAGPYTISVGAVPFFDLPPYGSPLVIRSEDFSSGGGATQIFDDNGNRLAQPRFLQKPDISAVDGVDTSFFGIDDPFSTVDPVNYPPDSGTMPNFFGTSAAAPHAAAAAALFKQLAGNVSVETIKKGMINSARPLNGAAAGVWDPIGGYGLIDILDAANAMGNQNAPEIEVHSTGPTIPNGTITGASNLLGTDFGAMRVGGSSVRTFVIRNLGGQPLTIFDPGIQISGIQGNEFTVIAQPASIILPGQESSFTVRFAPLSGTPNVRNGTIGFVNSDGDETYYTFNIRGTVDGTARPEAQLHANSPTGLEIVDGDTTPQTADNTDFGPRLVNSSTTFTYTMRNLGNTNLTFTADVRVRIDGPHASDFTVVAQPLASIGTGGSSNFQIRFTPSDYGLRQATVHISTDDGDELSYDFSIQGTGRSPLISGQVWYDLDADGTIDTGEPVGSGLQVYWDVNLNNVLDPVDISTITGTNGSYTFTNLPTGTLNFRVVAPPFFYPTTPVSGVHTIVVDGTADFTPRNFGIRQNIAPTLNASGMPMMTAAEDTISATGTTITAILATGAGGNPIADPDPFALRGIAVIAADTTNGLWEFSIDNAVSWQPLGVTSDASARLLAANPATRLRFVAANNFTGDIPAALGFRAWDQTQGANGQLFAITATGGATAFSSVGETLQVTVTPNNDAPTIAGPGRQGTRVDTPLVFSAGTTNAIVVNDVDATNLTVSLSAFNGILQLGSTSGLTSFLGDGSANVTITGSIANLNLALNGLTFTPTPAFSGDATLVVSAVDNGVSGAGGSMTGVRQIDISVRSAFSLESSILYVTGGLGTDTVTVNYFSPTQFAVTMGSVTNVYNNTDAPRTIVSLGSGGDVVIVVTDSTRADTVVLQANRMDLNNSAAILEVSGASFTYVFGDAADVASFNDTAGDDFFFGLPTTSVFLGGGVLNQVVGFGETYATATRGTDASVMFDSDAVDAFYSFETNAIIDGPGYFSQASGFDSYYGISNSGGDTAYLYDTPLDDTVVGQPAYTVLSNSRLVVVAGGFSSVIATGSAGNDAAFLFDGPGNDLFAAQPTYATLTGTGFAMAVATFDSVNAYGLSGGSNTAQFFGSAGNDTFDGYAGLSRMSGPGYVNTANSFAFVYADASSGGMDVATLYDTAGYNRLTASGSSALMSYGAQFISLNGFGTVRAISTSGGNDTTRIRNITFVLNVFGGWFAET